MGHPWPLFRLFSIFSNKHKYNFYKYTGPEFEPTTFGTCVSSHNHQTRAPTLSEIFFCCIHLVDLHLRAPNYYCSFFLIDLDCNTFRHRPVDVTFTATFAIRMGALYCIKRRLVHTTLTYPRRMHSCMEIENFAAVAATIALDYDPSTIVNSVTRFGDS